MTTFTSRDLEAADELALARLDDDGAPPAVTCHSQDHYAIRRGHTGKVASRLAKTAAAASGEEAEQTPTLPGAGSGRSRPVAAPQRTAPIRERRNLMPEPAAPHHGTTSTLPPPSANGSASRTRAAPSRRAAP